MLKISNSNKKIVKAKLCAQRIKDKVTRLMMTTGK